MDLSGKTVLIVGASGGIGSAITKRFSDSNLILADRDPMKLDSFVEDIKPKSVAKFKVDMNKIDEVRSLASEVARKFDVIDVLINATGVGVYKPIEEVSYEEWEMSLNVNLTSSYFLIQNLLNSLKASEKSYVVSLGSGMGKIPSPGRSVYCVTKFALRGMSLSLSEEFARTNVNFLHMVLGSVLTGFGPMSLQEKKEKSLSGKSYLLPESVADKIYELISTESKETEVELMPSGYEDPKNR